MDISNVTDLEKLKALAYDQIAAKENAEKNLQMINQRIMQLSMSDATPEQVRAALPNAGDAPSENASGPIDGEAVAEQ